MTMWLGSSVVRVLARSARGPGFESRSGRVLFPPLWHLVASVGEIVTGWPCSSVVRVLTRSARGLGFESRSGHVLFPPLWHLSRGKLSQVDLVAQWSEFSHDMQEVLGSSPIRAMCFFLPYDTTISWAGSSLQHAFMQLCPLLAHLSREAHKVSLYYTLTPASVVVVVNNV